MGKKKNVMETIADYLPGDLSEDTIEKVAQLISVTIQNKVEEEKEILTTKVSAFIRNNIDKLKEQAIKELELENPTFRNAQLFESMKAMFALENTAQDEMYGMNVIASLSESLEQKNESLLNQVEKLLKENIKLKNQVKISESKSAKLEESLAEVKENVQAIRENSKVATKGKFSDSALVISEDNFKVKEASEKLDKKHAGNGNEWIVPGVIETMKSLKG